MTDKAKESMEVAASYLGKRVRPPYETQKLESKYNRVDPASNVRQYLRQGQVV